ncbi:type VII secretion-associated serine protease mycosin [Streptomyces sp. AK02-01A]|uniref:type VII secretion-associated serine protease mycosin n=1 Tax=Streptomyces sp. AK02-01A TaxID=3028648 RepID=UPI0029A9BE21|nr:type VII secretion-associated serine protease mycosin [Streptomyces sp. AK02-01A]MDX3849093.1 type VII secretion-associated serine protease mycosin [Streptomyces sp. AK02-01A]
MRSKGIRVSRFQRVGSAVLGLLLAGVAATPAHAETVRSRQWHLDTLRADELWKSSTGEGVTVAVIDSGVEPVPDLEGQVLKGKDLSVKPGDEREDLSEHGTGIAAMIAGTGDSHGGDGAFGLAPGAKILPVRIDFGAGERGDANMAAAIRFAADSDAKILNISVAGLYEGRSLREAVTYALDKGKLIFAGVGNDGQNGNAVMYPAATRGVVGVAAVDRDISGTKESQRGPQVDLAAPGVDIISACSGETGLCKSHGTSDASALASASAALIWAKYPDWTNNQVLRVMLNTAGGPTSGAQRNDSIGYGFVRPRIALKTPGDPGPADEYPLPDFAAAAPKSPAPVASEPAKGTEDDGKNARQPAAAAPDDGSGPGLWIALGVGAAVLIGTAVAVPLVRSRRRAAAQAHQPPVPAFAPYQQQPHQQQPYQQPQYPQQPYGPPQSGQGPNQSYGPPPGPGHSG